MKTIKSIVFLIFLLISTLSAFPQHTFEKVYDDLEQSEIRAVTETSNNDFLFVIHPFDECTDDYILKVSSYGDIQGTFNYEFSEGFVKLFGLFQRPGQNDFFIALAAVYDGQSATDIAIISFDIDLNFIDEKRISFSDVVQNMVPIVIPSATTYDDEVAITAHVILKTGGYGHLYTRINLDGERLALQTDDSYNTAYALTSSIACIDNYKKRFAVLNTKIEDIGTGLGIMSLVVETMDSTMMAYKSQEIDYENTSDCPNFFFGSAETPVIKALNDSIIIMNLRAKEYDCANLKYFGNCLVEMDHELDITRTTFHFHEQNDIIVKIPLRNSFDLSNDYIYSCDIINLNNYHPLYKTKCLIVKYDMDMNVIWERFVNREEGYYYPHYVLATEDGGCLIAGYACDENYMYKYSYALKTDADGNLGVGENDYIFVRPYYVYPNPAKDFIIIEISPDVNVQGVSIYALDGRLVKSLDLDFGTIDISNLNAGIYIMKLRMSDGLEYSERIVKE